MIYIFKFNRNDISKCRRRGALGKPLQVDWEPLEFAKAERHGVPLLRGIDEIQMVLDDHISKTREATLLYIQDFIDQVIALQRLLDGLGAHLRLR